MKKYRVEVKQIVEVSIDEEQINEKFMQVFREVMYDFDDLSEHAEHIAQCEARGLIGFDKFLEGYGDLRELNCTFKVVDQETDVDEINP